MGRLSRMEKAKQLQERLEKAVAEEKRLKCQVNVVSDQIKTLDDEIKEIMTKLGVEKQQAGDYIVMYHPKKDSERFDYKRYQAEHAELVKPYIVTVPGGMYFNIN